MIPFLSIVIAIGLLVAVVRLCVEPRRREQERVFDEQFPLGHVLVFRGRYYAHWELSHFKWQPESGAATRTWPIRNCKLEIPYEGGWSWAHEAMAEHESWRQCPGECFDLEFRGRLLEKGYFGHLGMSRYRLEVLEMLSVTRCAPPTSVL